MVVVHGKSLLQLVCPC